MRIFFGFVMLLSAAVPVAAGGTWFIPAAASAAGAQGTNWRTEAVFVNPSSAPIHATLYFLEANRDNGDAAAHPLEIPAGHSITVGDLVGVFFSSPGKAGAVRVEADGLLVMTTRTFNDLGAAGTYGQGIPALSPESAVGPGEPRTLYPLVRTDAYRSNIGLVNLGLQPVTVRAEFYVPERMPYPVQVTAWDLLPWEYLQIGDVLAPYDGGAGVGLAWAVLTTDAPGGGILPWVSMVDNRTGDPVFSPDAERSALMAPAEREWVRIMGAGGDDLAHAVAVADDGGIWVAGESDSSGSGAVDGEVMKVDAWGRVVARWELPGFGQFKIFGLRGLPGGGAVLCGGWTDPDGAFWSAWAMALSSEGFPFWSRLYGQAESAWLYGIVPMPDGTYRACGQIQPADGSPADAWVMALDDDGDVLWQRRLSGPMEDWLYALAATPDGGVAAAGATRSFGGSDWDAWLVKLDGAGAVLWERIYGGAGQEAAYGLGVLPGGDLVLAGQTDSWGTGGPDLWLLRADPLGAFVWGRTLGTRDADTAYTLAVAPDGRILTVGQRGDIIAGHGDAWMAEWDSDGSFQAQGVAGGMEPERLYGAAARPDGGWLAGGRTQSAGAGGKDLLLLSLPEGLVQGDPCTFLTEPPGAPAATPSTGTQVSSSVTDSAAMPGLGNHPILPSVPWTDQVLCGSIHDGPFRSLVPAVARTEGAGDTHWRTDLFVRLPEGGWGETGSARITFLRSGQDNPSPAEAVVTGFPGGVVEVLDVLSVLFGEDAAYGALLVEADGPFEAWTDTYTQNADGGTLGQGIPAFAEEACLKAGEPALLPALTRSPEYRTNIGFAGPGSAGALLSVEVRASDGTLLGTREYGLPAAGHLQVADFLAGFGDRLEGAYAVVRSDSPGACYFAYASVVDNRTGDPVFIPATRAAVER